MFFISFLAESRSSRDSSLYHSSFERQKTFSLNVYKWNPEKYLQKISSSHYAGYNVDKTPLFRSTSISLLAWFEVLSDRVKVIIFLHAVIKKLPPKSNPQEKTLLLSRSDTTHNKKEKFCKHPSAVLFTSNPRTQSHNHILRGIRSALFATILTHCIYIVALWNV